MAHHKLYARYNNCNGYGITGVLMTAISPLLIGALLIIVIVYLFFVDLLKVPMFNYLGII